MVDDGKEDVTQFVVKHAPALRSLSAKHVANLYDDVMVMSDFSPARQHPAGDHRAGRRGRRLLRRVAAL